MADEVDGQDWTSQWSAPSGLPPPDPDRSPWPVHERPDDPQPPPTSGPLVAPHRPLWPVTKPASHGLYVTYVLLMALLYVGCTAVGIWLRQADLDLRSTSADPEEVRATALVFVAVGPPLALLFGIAAFLPKRPWSWAYGLVMIIIGLTSCCTWPVTIPLLLRWFRPEIKRYYHKA